VSTPLGGPGLAGLDPIWAPRLSRLSRWLVVYGVVGLVVAVVAVGALAAGLSRVAGLSDALRGDANGISETLLRTADVIESAASTSDEFGRTIDRTTAALGTVGTDIRDIVPRLHAIETQANAITILGSAPLAPVAGLFGDIARQLADVQTQLDAVSASLGSNRGSLSTTAASLTKLATQTRDLSTKLGGDSVPNALDDARWLFVAVLGVAALGAAMPAVGALALGLWLRRELGLRP
jgi:methyl-accepting chemotaxis protein